MRGQKCATVYLLYGLSTVLCISHSVPQCPTASHITALANATGQTRYERQASEEYRSAKRDPFETSNKQQLMSCSARQIAFPGFSFVHASRRSILRSLDGASCMGKLFPHMQILQQIPFCHPKEQSYISCSRHNKCSSCWRLTIPRPSVFNAADCSSHMMDR